ncbi:TonB-dependent receptor [uncultured Tenacibaculum sp.]|uniref:TonB-dependent receptor n=1 Tax=uncultured Tenacibaculum sp. TaxID=174713 RepID=UPI0026368C07|nr:TonB-dependent receptor [uncultured Tenacibaculum sp.]
MKKLFTLLFTIVFSGFTWAQMQISGTVTDSNNDALPGANIIEKGTQNGANTDFDGKFNLTVQEGAILVVSFSGYETQEVSVNGKKVFNIVLKEGLELDEVIITGSRTPSRSNTTSSLPIDVVGVKELQATGQTTFDKALQYKIPSFNTVQTPVNDATSLLDPYEIRNMGPSRTLILINGKRKNLSSLLYTQTSPGRGETGADISGIPTDAIETIQILRDGASAQYGSDAIAGVMNIILKKDYKNGSATFRSGITGEGDGEMLGVSVNNGSRFGKKGFINYTIDFSKTKMANRPGTVDAEGEAADFGANINFVNEFLGRKPDAGNINASPQTTAAKFLINGSHDLSENSDLYFNAAYVYKMVNSFANYRTPYWRTIGDFPYLANFFPGDHPTNAGGYDGYLPTFEGLLGDYNATVGIKSTINDWNVDGSITVGGNKQTYTVSNSHNRSTILDSNNENIYRENSPISFKPGGTAFSHVVGNLDISKILSDNVSIALGTEFRAEDFEVIQGGLASYDGIGADSFAGNRPENSGEFNRYNLGGYFSVEWDATKDFQLNGTVRAENYSDFGSTFVWKVSSRYKFADDKYTIRASASTGFRAPTLHQIYTQKKQYSFVAGSGIQVSGLINNVSREARQLGVPRLKAEESTNFTVGIGGKPFNNFSFTLDYYNIEVEDRIVLSNELSTTFGTVSYFANAINTRTSGLDVVIGYKNLELGNGKLGFNLSGNYTFENGRTDNNGSALIDATQEALLFTSRPNTKWILGATYDVGNFGFTLNNTYFGTTKFKQAGMDSNLRTEFTPQIVTDLGVNYNIDDNWTVAFNANNILSVLPEWSFKAENAAGQAILNDPAQVKTQSNLITFNQRYSQMTYDGYHFSQLGSMFNLSVNYKF